MVTLSHQKNLQRRFLWLYDGCARDVSGEKKENNY